MTPTTVDIRTTPDAQRAIADAGAALRDGQLILLATETVIGLAASAASSRALDALWTLKPDAERAPLAWHLPSTNAALEILRPASLVQHRLITKLTPGPVTFRATRSPARLAELLDDYGVRPRAFDDGDAILVRVPGSDAARRTIAAASTPVVMASITDQGRLVTDIIEAARILNARPGADALTHALHDGTPVIGSQSTLIEIDDAGGYRVLRTGALEERYIQKMVNRTLLFVCTGNTCRSPMAEAIGRHLVEESPVEGVVTTVRSAGIYAGPGAPASHEAKVAVEAMGIDFHSHASKPLSRELINEADAIYTMTNAHRDAIVTLEPAAADRVHVLDPAGADIPDPIGQAQRVYDDTARVIRDCIRTRLDELNRIGSEASS